MDATHIDLIQKLEDCTQGGDLLGIISLLQGPDARNHVFEALCNAAYKGYAECALLLIPLSDPKADNSLALTLAAEQGHTECLRLLIPVSDPKANDSSALCFAAYNGHAECVKLLIPVSDPKALSSDALHRAARNGHPECVKALIPVSDPNDRSKALCIAARHGHAECLRLLLPASAPNDRREALQYAIDCRKNECAKLLIPARGSLLKNKKALSSAIFYGDAELLSLMLACEPLILTGLNTSRHLDAAIAKGHANLALLLSSIIEQKALAADLAPAPARDVPRRL